MIVRERGAYRDIYFESSVRRVKDELRGREGVVLMELYDSMIVAALVVSVELVEAEVKVEVSFSRD